MIFCSFCGGGGSSSTTMATDSPSSQINRKTSPSKNREPSKRHEYTSLHDLLEFPCKCPICTYVRQRREPGPQLADTLVTRLALATLPSIPDPPRLQSKRLPFRRSPRGLRAPVNATLELLNRHVVVAISRAFWLLIGAVQATEDEEDATPRGRLPFKTC